MNDEEIKVIEHLKKVAEERTIIPLDDEIAIVLNLIEKQKAEIEKKYKMIDLMANSFAEEGFYSEHCQTLIDNDICPDNCNNCIKQYFEKKAEEEK